MTPAAAPVTVITPRRHLLAWLLNPYLMIVFSALLDTASEVLLAKGALAVNNTVYTTGFFWFMAPLVSGWTWIGISTYITSLVVWLHILRTVPLSVAFPLISVVQVLVPAASRVFLHEPIPPQLWAGVGMIFLGVLVIAQPLMRVEEKL